METPTPTAADASKFAVTVLVLTTGTPTPAPAQVRAGLVPDTHLVSLRLLPDGPEWRLTHPDASCLGLALLELAAMTQTEDYLADLPCPRLLPTVTLDGRDFVLDERLGQLRAVDDPTHTIRLTGGLFD